MNTPSLDYDQVAAAYARHRQVHPGVLQSLCLDFRSDTFDLVFSVDVVHHVENRSQYLHEAYRVLKTGGRICTVTDSECVIRHRQPLTTYFPETVEAELARYPHIAALCEMMAQTGFDEIAQDAVECPYPLTDIQAYRDKAYSALHLISEEAFQRGIARMERDLGAGPIPCISRYTLLWGRKSRRGEKKGWAWNDGTAQTSDADRQSDHACNGS